MGGQGLDAAIAMDPKGAETVLAVHSQSIHEVAGDRRSRPQGRKLECIDSLILLVIEWKNRRDV
jgi:hypothetical protein